MVTLADHETLLTDPPAGRARPRPAGVERRVEHDPRRRRCSRTTATSTSRCMPDRRRAGRQAERRARAALWQEIVDFHRVERLAAAAGQRGADPAPAARGADRALPHGRLGGVSRKRQGGAGHLHALGARQARLFPLRAEAGARAGLLRRPGRLLRAGPARLRRGPVRLRHHRGGDGGSKASRSPASTGSSASAPSPTAPPPASSPIADDEFALCVNRPRRARRRARSASSSTPERSHDRRASRRTAPTCALDLTRWNRAGLTRFQYVDGDARGVARGAADRAPRPLSARRRPGGAHAGELARPVHAEPAVRVGPVAGDRDAALCRRALAWADLSAGLPGAAGDCRAAQSRGFSTNTTSASPRLWLGDHARLRPRRARAARPPRRLCQRGLSAHRDAVGQCPQARGDGELPAGAACFRRRRPSR